MRKKLFVLFLTFVLALCVACGSKSENTVSDSASQNNGNTVSDSVSQNSENTVSNSTALNSGNSVSDSSTQNTEATVMRVAALKGPTAMGLSKLISDSDTENTADGSEKTDTGVTYEFTLAGSADEITPKLISGELDVACIPANLASVLYKKTEGEIMTLNINTLGVIYIVDTSGEIDSLDDLIGKSLVGAGKGSTPEYALRYLLEQNGINPDEDLTIEWKSEHSECVAALAAGTDAIALLPQPFVTVAQSKIPGLTVAIDLTEEWNKIDNGSTLITGVTVITRSFAESYPEAVKTFLSDYSDSVGWVNDNTSEAAEIIGGLGIADAAVAEKALPYCNIVCVDGAEMKTLLSGYLEVLYEQAPESIGGALPEAGFYYGS